MSDTYDFIVVGSGPAGCILATRLASTPARPQVILLEAGSADANPTADQGDLTNRMLLAATSPHLNWGYKTVPQSELDDRQIDYSRGKVLGGSSAINFAFWTVGPRDDYDEWARLVGDDAFAWERMRERLRKIERYRFCEDEKARGFVAAARSEHGANGAVDVEITPEPVPPKLLDMMGAMRDGADVPMCPDMNSGDPIGAALVVSTSKGGQRVTAKTAFLQQYPENLTVKTDSAVRKIVFEGKTAVGVECLGATYKARREIILCAGALDSPKLLMLSGIGDEQELSKHSIPVLQHLPGIGKNLQDHPFALWLYQRKAPPPSDASFFAAFLKSKATLASPEFSTLPSPIQRHLSRPTVPTHEAIWGLPPPFPGTDPSKTFFEVAVILQNPQSCGTVTLSSSNPDDPPLLDPKLFTNAFDKTNMFNAIRETMAAKGANPRDFDDIEFPINEPTDLSDEGLWEYVRQNTGTAWHMSCTVKMGQVDDDQACVDSDFFIRGVEGLRVADMSVTPFLPSCHTVSVAYLIGETAAEKITEKFKLNDNADT